MLSSLKLLYQFQGFFSDIDIRWDCDHISGKYCRDNVMAISEYYHSVHLEGLRKVMKYLTYTSQSSAKTLAIPLLNVSEKCYSFN